MKPKAISPDTGPALFVVQSTQQVLRLRCENSVGIPFIACGDACDSH